MSQLNTIWLCVATSGKTVDGREISPTDLLQMAENYNPELYTALIWQEHQRANGNLGQVVALKSETVGDEVKLFATLRPNARLLELNQQRQKLFTSIEIIPDFARTGKAYLGGLAVTDSPASVGTTQLHFSINGIQQSKFVMGNKEPLNFTNNWQEDEINSILNQFKYLDSNDKSLLFSILKNSYRNNEVKPSQAAFIAAQKAIDYQKNNAKFAI